MFDIVLEYLFIQNWFNHFQCNADSLSYKVTKFSSLYNTQFDAWISRWIIYDGLAILLKYVYIYFIAFGSMNVSRLDCYIIVWTFKQQNLTFINVHWIGNDQTDCNVTSIWESDMSMDRCPHEDWTVPFIAAIFVLFSNLLLVNLVIAMFR